MSNKYRKGGNHEFERQLGKHKRSLMEERGRNYENGVLMPENLKKKIKERKCDLGLRNFEC